MMCYAALETPCGPLTVVADDEYVHEIRFGRRRARPGTPTPILREAVRQLKQYFAGRRTTFDLPLRLVAPRFKSAVLAELEAIPPGETRSYGEVAEAVGSPRGARAVGQAVGSNPLPVVIPCHRVLAANRRLGGFGGGLKWKRFLLELEGATWKRASRA